MRKVALRLAPLAQGIATSIAIAGCIFALSIAVLAMQAPVRVPKSVLERYVGEWVYPDGNTVMVRLEGDTLFREVPGQRVPFVPISETLFRLGFVFTAEFVIDQSGGITQILSDGTGVEYRLSRKGSRAAVLPAASAAPVRVPRSVLERYVGVYDYIPGQMKRTDLTIVMRLEGDTLIRDMGEKQILTPLSETRFRVAGTSLMVEFVIDDAGVTQVLGSGGQQMLARMKQKRVAPATPVGQAVSEWIDAFNSADSAKLRAYYDRHRLIRSMKAQLDLRQLTGGFDLVSIEKSTPRYIEFVVKERARGFQAVGVFELSAEDTPGMRQMTVQVMPTGKQFADFTIDAARRASVIDHAIDSLNNDYVFSDVALKMAADVRARLQRGEYDDVTNGITFAARLTEHFREVSHDKHLAVRFLAGAPPQGPPAQEAPGGPSSCGFTATRESDGKVGIIKLSGFADLTPQCGGEATEAIGFVADTDALIFDLRENGGGDARMVAFLSSYLFDGRTHLNDVMTRRRDASGQMIVPDQFWAHESWANDPDVPGRKYGGKKPVYVLTSSLTFSAAEEFTYNLQALKRATTVGEQTGGGAHPTRPAKIDDQFSIGVPFARSVNPITKTNWEGTGVTPDVKVPAVQALETAKNLITQKAK